MMSKATGGRPSSIVSYCRGCQADVPHTRTVHDRYQCDECKTIL